MIVDENKILWAKTKENAIIPTKEDENAGYDIYACFEEDYIIINPMSTKLIPTGIACALNEKYYMQLEERGSTGSKGIKRSAGIIDSGYRGEIFVALTNCNKIPIIISKSKDKTEFENSKILSKDFDVFWNDYIFYPYSKAICQGIIHESIKLQNEEVSYEELLKYSSNRGTGKLGSSKK